MFNFRASLLIAGLVGLVAPAGAFQQVNPKAGKPKLPIKVVVRFSVQEVNPQDPKDSYLECLVSNEGKVAVQLPTLYENGFDRDMILKGDPVEKERWGLWLVSKGAEKKSKQKLEALEPGKERNIFKATLQDILLLDPDPKNRKLRWDWEA